MPRFLKLLLSGKSLCVCVSQAIKNHSREMKPELTNQTSPTAFQFLCMALAIDTIDGRGLSNEVRRELLPKKSKATLHYTVKAS